MKQKKIPEEELKGASIGSGEMGLLGMFGFSHRLGSLDGERLIKKSEVKVQSRSITVTTLELLVTGHLICIVHGLHGAVQAAAGSPDLHCAVARKPEHRLAKKFK